MTPNDPEELDSLDELDDLDEVEELEELDEIEPAPEPKPAAKPAAAKPRTNVRAGGGSGGGGSRSAREMGPRKLQVGEKRELEQAPLELRKAAQVLLYGSLAPFFYGVTYATVYASEGYTKKTLTAFPWGLFFGVKAIALVGCWFFHESYKATHGGNQKGAVAKLASANKFVGPGIASLIWIAAIAMVFQAGTPTFDTNTATGGVVRDIPMGNWKLAVEVLSVILGGATITHIYGYEHGGRFNPIFPLLFFAPLLGGLLNLFGAGAVMGSPDKAPGMLGLVGSVVLIIAGGMAAKTMIDAMKEAKVAGELRQQAIREERKRQREARKGQ